MKVGVVGAGTAGAAAALFLARAGFEVTVLERVVAPGPVGAGIVLQPTGQAVLAQLGLLDPILAGGARLDRLWCRTSGGRTLVDLRYAAIDARWFGIGLHRGALFETLYRAAKAEPGVAIETGCDVRGLRREGTHVFVTIADGSERGPFALLVVADGAVSELRGAAGLTARDRPYPWGALWFVADDPDRSFRDELYQVGLRARRLYGALPTGMAPGRSGPVVSLFWSLRADRVDAWRAAGLAPWKAEVIALDPRMAPLLDQIRDPAQVLFARYRDIVMRRWHDDAVVFIGDAAHATSPQLGQGANLALCDAAALAEAIHRSRDVATALVAYAAARRRHLAYYQRMTRWLTPFFQSDSRVLGWLRDWLFPLGNALPPARGLMIRTMAGVKLGFVRRSLALPEGVTRALPAPSPPAAHPDG